jgi:exodeoxyribonuclease X
MIIRCLDVETCGLPPDHCQVCEIATVDLVQAEPGAAWQRGRVWSTLVNPGVPIPPESSAVHHITDDMVTDAPTLEEALPGVLGEPDCNVFAAHEAKFERACLPQIAGNISICTRKCAATLWRDAPNYQAQTLRYWLGLKFKDPIVPHRALGDATVTAAILRACLNEVKLGRLFEITANPVRLARLSFGKHAMVPTAEVPTDYWDWMLNKGRMEDEDALYTARCELEERRAASRSRSPV